MRVERNVKLEYALWFLGISLFPVYKLVRSPGQWLYACFLELVLAVLLLGNYRKQAKDKVLYESDDERIGIQGSKEGQGDPGTILLSQVDEVLEEKHTILIKLKEGRPIRLRRLGRHKAEVFKDLAGRLASHGR